MGWIKGTIFFFCIPFLTIYWSDGVFAVPDISLPCSGDCSSRYSSSGPPLIYVNPIRNPPKTGYCSTEKRQQLLNQASILLKKLSPYKVGTSLDIPSIVETEDLETVVIQNLVNCLGALDKKNTAAITPIQNPVVISKVTYDYIVNQYREIRILIRDCLSVKDAKNVISALDDLYDTFKKIITGKLLNVELSNLCSKILALNTQLEATDASEDLQAGIADFIKSLTSALTGQSQVTITAICKCLNELETSVVTIVQDGKAEKLQDLLSSLINAMINAVVSADDGCDVVEIVQKYVASINEAIKQDAESRAGKIYGSVLNFEKHLSKVLIGSGSTVNQDNSDPLKDASAIVTNGTLFIIKEHVEQLLDDDENIVEVKRSGSYYLKDPETEISWTGNYAVQQGSIVSDSDGSVTIANSGFYDVILINDVSKSSKRQGVFDLQDNIILKKDKYGYPERIEYGIYSLKDSLTSSASTGQFVVTNTISQRNPDRSIDVTKAGVLFVDDPTSVSSIEEPSSESYDGYFLIEEYISNSTSINGRGIFNIKNSKTLGEERGSYAIRDFGLNLNTNGSIDLQTTGVFYNDSYTIRVKGYSPAPIISKGSHFTFNDHVDPSVDKYEHIGLIGTGELTQTDPKTGKKTSKNYVIFNIILIFNPDGSTNITKLGRFITVDENPSTTVSTTKKHSSLDPTDSPRPLLVSKKSFQALLTGLNLVASNQTPRPQVRPVDEKTNPQIKPPVVTNVEPTLNNGTGIALDLEYNVTSIAANGTFAIINEFITPLLDSNGNVLSLIKIGTFWFRDEKTNISWSGAFETTEYSVNANSPNEMNTTKVGTLEVTPSPHGLCAPDADQVNGFFTLDAYVVTGNNGAITITENGKYSLTDSTTADTKTGRFVVLNNYTKLLNDGVIEVVKTAILFDDPDTECSSKEISLSGSGRYFIFDDLSSINPAADGNKGTGVYSMKDTTTNEQISGIYVINERTITEHPDGTVDLITVGVIYVNGSGFSESGSIPSVRNGATFTSTDHLVTVTDVYGHSSTFGTGSYTQIDLVTGEVQSANYELKNVVTSTGDNGSTRTLKLGRIPNDAYISGGKVSSTPETIPADDTVYCFFQDHVSSNIGNQGNSGTGEYRIDYPAQKNFAVGTYDILERSSIANSDGSTTWKTSGIIHFNSTASSTSNSDRRLTILEGAQFTMEDYVFYSRDQNKNIIAVGTGILTQIIPSTGLIITTKYTINEFLVNLNSDGSQDIRKSGTIDELPTIDVISKLTNPSNSPSNSAPVLKDTVIVDPNSDQVYISFEDHLYSPSNIVGIYGMGKYKLENPLRKEVVAGNYVIQERSITNKCDGTTQIKKSGVIYVDSSQSTPSNSDSRLTILNGAYTSNEYVSITKDENDNFIVIGTGLLTQPVSKSGIVRYINYTITYFSTINNFDGSQEIVTSGTVLYTAAIADSINFNKPPKSSDPLSKPLQIITEQDETVSFLFLDVLFGTPHSDGTFGTGKFRIDNQVRGEFIAGSYDIYERNTTSNSNGTVNIKTSGVIYLDSSNSSPIITDTKLTILDGAECVFEEYLQYSKDVNGIVIVTGNGKLTQTDRNAALITITTYAIESYSIDYNSDNSQVITKAGTIQDSSTLAYLSSTQILSDPRPAAEVASVCVTLPRADVVAANRGINPKPGNIVIIKTNNGKVLSAKIKDNQSPLTFNLINLAELSDIFATGSVVWNIAENTFSAENRILIDTVAGTQPC